ncbi:MAG: polysaccharide deacetylase family protein [Flavobacteriales bacterium]|jgi:peptidoglycan/xylan/chitin deacetylase (PgdA/CDA1 family)|nr:polysaccharide deacetylase family protein [Flavobacteriales bacterium]
MNKQKILSQTPLLLRKIYPNRIWRLNKNQPSLCITFDDGPTEEITEWVLDVLESFQIQALFFVIGKNVQNHLMIYQKILDKGHQVGNHTMNHADGWKVSKEEYVREVEACRKIVNSTLFRPPYGHLTKKQEQLLVTMNFQVIMWDVISFDFDNSLSGDQCLEILKNKVRNGSVIVFHDSQKAFERLKYCLPKFIEWALSNGYHFVPYEND